MKTMIREDAEGSIYVVTSDKSPTGDWAVIKKKFSSKWSFSTSIVEIIGFIYPVNHYSLNKNPVSEYNYFVEGRSVGYNTGNTVFPLEPESIKIFSSFKDAKIYSNIIKVME